MSWFYCPTLSSIHPPTLITKHKITSLPSGGDHSGLRWLINPCPTHMHYKSPLCVPRRTFRSDPACLRSFPRWPTTRIRFPRQKKRTPSPHPSPHGWAPWLAFFCPASRIFSVSSCLFVWPGSWAQPELCVHSCWCWVAAVWYVYSGMGLKEKE